MACKMMKWISVKDRLPKQHEWVLAFCDNTIYLATYRAKGSIGVTCKDGIPFSYPDKDEWMQDSCCNDILEPATHWMPLPKFPEE
jgi:Protein of unknown function (DUF551)